ncbi:uncharacterized protein LOC108745218 [Agrilus planipennis]|uniref:Uncharacterized protein LOC108745218 n=1 Tax=Agrilus planipennis TaxID=224129 RepID=A0A1W4XLK4_AGRPL|nr:uncharacterized protein LOC108745218 [Agrilus planipennis]
MTSSTFCEHCFCIGGQQRCIRPKCLLQIQGCQPVYEDYSCCPVRYDCTIKHQVLPPSQRNHIEVTTVKLSKKKNGGGGIREGCFVSKKYYPEGSKVLGLGYSVCDNCYCVHSVVRCEPMSCAPPLLGCTPVIKEGECCATSYNCNNSIEIQPNPNYGEFPEISKEYAKLRKEVPLWSNQEITQKISVDNGLHYVIAQSLNNIHSEKPETLRRNSINPVKEIHHNAYKRHTSPSATASKYPNVSTNLKQFVQIQTTHYKPKPIKSSPKYSLDGRVIRKVDNKSLDRETTMTIARTATTKNFSSISTSTTTTTIIPNSEITSTNTQDPNITTEMTEMHTSTIAVSGFETDSTLSDSFIADNNNETVPTVITTVVSKSTCLETSTNVDETTIELTTTDSNVEAKQEIDNKSNTMKVQDENKSNATIVSGYTTSSDLLNTELDSKVNVSTPTFILLPAISPLIGGILNESTVEDSADYDYSEPTLPPSLPNLRIIPFVAADAVDETNEEENTRFSPVTQSPPYTLFSPPTKTEGGFVPKEPPLSVEGYDSSFHVATTHADSDKVTSTKPLTEIPNVLNYSCQVESTLFEHGQTVPGKDACTICTCLYGKVACHEPECPPPEIYCREPSVKEILSCCPSHFCGDDLSDGPVDRADAFDETLGNYSANKSSNGGKLGDREEMPFLNLNFSHSSLPRPSKPSSEYKSSLPTRRVQTLNNNNINGKPDRKHLSNEINETTKDTNQNTSSDSQFGPAKIYGNNNKSMLTTSTTAMTLTSHGQNDEVAVSIAGGEDKGNNIDGTVGVLKLAGCNIYGRMYRVGKIIFELSGPCLECRCTDVGVQCKSNKC